MLKARIISAVIMVPVIVLSILFLPSKFLSIASAIVFMIAAWEWICISIAQNVYIRLILLTFLILVAASILANGIDPYWIYTFCLLSWIGIIIALRFYPRGKSIWQQLLLQPLVGLILFVPPWLAFTSLQEINRSWLLIGCCLIWSTDIGAYTFGKLWGKDKLLPNVSPNKTIAGVYGGFTFAIITILIGYYLAPLPFNLMLALVLAIITVSFGIIGDLFESMIKRVYGVKDSGKLIPGHGGMFDRIDSMLAALPIYYLGLINFHVTSIMSF